jgi:hypothetical protein
MTRLSLASVDAVLRRATADCAGRRIARIEQPLRVGKKVEGVEEARGGDGVLVRV